MDAKKLQPFTGAAASLEQTQRTFEGLPTGDDGSWLETLESYRGAGIVNENLVEMMSAQLRWYTVYSRQPFYNFTKFVFDRTVALTCILALSPLFLLVVLAIKSTSTGPVFFTQLRIGQYCRPFRIFKFRTMQVGSKRSILFNRNEMHGGLFKIRKDPRVTPVGRFLRRWSIDEMPQLLNVLLGDMSLVGPRPLPPEDTATVKELQYLRFACKPGLTGFWQATARDSSDGSFKLVLDALYVERRSWRFDLWLVWRTIITIVKGIGAW